MGDEVLAGLRRTFEDVGQLGKRLESLAKQGLEQVANATRTQKRSR